MERRMRFSDVTPALSAPTLAALRGLGFAAMTPVQAATIPLFLGNKDVAVEAQTGSGKTLAFVIPVIERVRRLDPGLKPSQVGAVIISPTRELARQTHAICETFLSEPGSPSLVLLTGGTEVRADIDKCARGCNIVVATPGRLLDVLKRGGEALEWRTLDVLILDEADTLLDMGFAETLTDILSRLPKQRRTGLFSATQTKEVQALAKAGLRNPALISVKVHVPAAAPPPAPAPGTGTSSSSSSGGGEAGADSAAPAAAPAAPAAAPATQATPLTLTNHVMICTDSADKLHQLVAFLRRLASIPAKSIVFVLTCASVDYYAKIFSSPAVREAAGLPPAEAFPILPLHGQMAPKKRIGNYDTFVASEAGVLLCTDVAARGVDVPDVDWIVQFDPPKDPAFFIHRVGRTARAGRRGQSLLLLLPKEEGYVSLLAVKQVPLQEMPREATLPGSEALIPALRSEALADRDVLEKSTAAFVSFIRGYKEHHASYVFKLEKLDIGALAAAFGLVKLPKVDELRGRPIAYEGVPGVDTSTISYKDAFREAQRQKRLVSQAEELAAEREARDARRDKALKLAAKAAADPKAAKPAKKRKHKGTLARLEEDWDWLAQEERLDRQLRKGKISKAEYKKAMAELARSQGMADEEVDEVVGTTLAVEDERSGGGAGGRGKGGGGAAADDDDEALEEALRQINSGRAGKDDDDEDDDDDDGGGGSSGKLAGTKRKRSGGGGSGAFSKHPGGGHQGSKPKKPKLKW